MAKQTEQRDFLKVGALKGRKTGTIKITGEPRRMRGKFGNQIIVPVRFNGTEYDWAFREGGRVHQSLRAAGYKGEHTIKVESFVNKDDELISYLALDEKFEDDKIPF